MDCVPFHVSYDSGQTDADTVIIVVASLSPGPLHLSSGVVTDASVSAATVPRTVNSGLV